MKILDVLFKRLARTHTVTEPTLKKVIDKLRDLKVIKASTIDKKLRKFKRNSVIACDTNSQLSQEINLFVEKHGYVNRGGFNYKKNLMKFNKKNLFTVCCFL
tara:strand:- start:271 stop:576 length:306 start_codon:yes stop_codon:yes gene_type:complete